MNVLIVDDSKAMRMIVRRAIKQANIECSSVAEAANGAEALVAIRANCPDVVLSDWNMPVMSGIELLQAIRREGNNVKFVFVTSEGTDEMRSQALASGARGIIQKPFSDDTFRAAFAGLR